MEGIPLDNGQWKEGVLVVICGSMKLAKCQKMAMSKDPNKVAKKHPKTKNHPQKTQLNI